MNAAVGPMRLPVLQLTGAAAVVDPPTVAAHLASVAGVVSPESCKSHPNNKNINHSFFAYSYRAL